MLTYGDPFVLKCLIKARTPVKSQFCKCKLAIRSEQVKACNAILFWCWHLLPMHYVTSLKLVEGAFINASPGNIPWHRFRAMVSMQEAKGLNPGTHNKNIYLFYFFFSIWCHSNVVTLSYALSSRQRIFPSYMIISSCVHFLRFIVIKFF